MIQTDWRGLSPITAGENWCYKREDLFLPFGDRGINGSKLRQVYHLCELATKMGKKGIVSGAVKDSPQHPMVTKIAAEYGLSSLCVTGTKKIEEYPMLKLASDFGATFVASKVGYAATLNAIARRIAKEENLFHLETNITVTGDASYLHSFHEVGGYQVANVPHKVQTIFIPAGSCNSATSVMVGLAQDFMPLVKEIVLFGIGAEGSRKPEYIPDRLKTISKSSGICYEDIFDFDLMRHPSIARLSTDQRVKVVRYDLNGTGFCKYEDCMPFTKDGIVFHPRYEGKILRYIEQNEKEFASYENDSTCFWVVGSEPSK